MDETLASPTTSAAERSLNSVDNAIDHHVETESLTSVDIRADPILSSLAKQQARTISATPAASANTGFKARPAPSTTHLEGVGPRMTKSAALRQGLKWKESPRKQASHAVAESPAKGPGNTSGHRRGLSINIPSLAAPSITPRATKASQLRTGGTVTSDSPIKRDTAFIFAANKARADEEKQRRRASVALPASLSAPQIAPRMNRSAALRAGGIIASPSGPAAPPISSRAHSALAASSTINLGPGEPKKLFQKDEEKVKRRASVIGVVKSLGAPSIQPRMNRSAMLRAPPSGGSIPTSPSLSSIAPAPARPKITSTPSASSISVKSVTTLENKVSTALGPRPTKSSLLRANLGAKVLSR